VGGARGARRRGRAVSVQPGRPSICGALRRYRELVYLVVAGLAMIGYTYATPPLLPEAWASMLPLLGRLPGDLAAYAWRFLLSFGLLGVLPFLAALALGETPRSLGLRWPRRPFPWGFFGLFVAVMLLAGWMGGRNPQTAAYYPYSRTLLQRFAARDFRLFPLHALLYTGMYYLPWELFFRGILLLPFLRLVERARGVDGRPGVGPPGSRVDPALFTAACLQVVPSVMLHYHHPLPEVIVSLPFAVALGYLVLRTRSILPAVALHALVGVGQDLVISLRAAGFLGG
ncbi:MAG: CPBP family intramembrane metalloprotease, partial [Spirochaetales bacterium]|nr:CPBP family intramembrane metalloprotease [Spirochaetales bacterium]